MVVKKLILFFFSLFLTTALFSAPPSRPHPHYYQGRGEIAAGVGTIALQFIKNGLPKNLPAAVSSITAVALGCALITHGNYLLKKNS